MRILPFNVVNGKVYYYARPLISSTRYLFVSGDGLNVQNGAAVIAYTGITQNHFNASYGDRFWYLTKTGDYYFIKNYNGSKTSFCIHAASASNGAAVTVQNCNSSNNQKWKIVGV